MSLFELSLLNLTSQYREVANRYLENQHENQYILTNVLDHCQKIKGDSSAIYMYYLAKQYSKLFDLLEETNENVYQLTLL